VPKKRLLCSKVVAVSEKEVAVFKSGCCVQKWLLCLKKGVAVVLRLCYGCVTVVLRLCYGCVTVV
jgi:hypothetical protein